MAVAPQIAGKGPQVVPQPQVKVTVTHTAPTAARAIAGVHAAAGRPPPPAPAAAPAAFNPLAGNLSTQGLANLAQRITAGQTQASLVPLRAQAAGITGSERTVSNQYAANTAGGDQIIQGLQQNQAQGALSNENAAAQAAQQTANMIDQTGAAARNLYGGPLAPQTLAAQQAQSQFGGTYQGANAGFVNSQMQNQANFLTNMRGVAALQGIQGQGNIASIYGKQLATNRAAQQALLLRQPSAAKSLAVTLGQQQFTDEATRQALGLKGQAAATAAKNANTNAYRAVTNYQLGLGRNAVAALNAQTSQDRATTQRNYDTALAGIDSYKAQHTAAYQSGSLAIRTQIANNAQANQIANQQIRRLQAQTGRMNAEERIRHDKALEAAKKTAKATAPNGVLSQPQNLAAVGKINAAMTEYERLRGTTIASGTQAGQRISDASARTEIIVRQRGGVEGRAGIELATQGYVSADTVALLRQQGIVLPPSVQTQPTVTGTTGRASAGRQGARSVAGSTA